MVEPKKLWLLQVYQQNIRLKLTGLLGGALLVTLILMSLSIFLFVARTERMAWQGRQEEVSYRSAKVVSEFLQNTENILLLVGSLKRHYPGTESYMMQTILRYHPSLLEIVQFDSNGHIRANATQMTPILTNPVTIPQSTWFLQASKGQPYIGDLQISADGEPYLIIALPLEDEGIIAARLRMSVLWEVVADIQLGQTGNVYVVNQQGRIVAHTRSQIPLTNKSLKGRPEMVALREAPNHEWDGFYTNFEDVPVVGVTTPVLKTDWVVITELARSEAFAASRTALLVLSAGTLLIGTFVMLISTRLMRQLIFDPIGKLQSGAEQIGRGNLNYYIDLPRQDEIGQVAETFNHMVSQLRDREAQRKAWTATLEAEVIERRATEERLREAEAKYRRLVEHLPAITFTVEFGETNTTSYISPQIESILGFTEAEWMTDPNLWIRQLHPDDREWVLAEVYDKDRKGEPLNIEYRVRARDGRVIWLHNQTTWMQKEARQTRYTHGIMFDITERKQAEEALKVYAAKLERSNQELEQFAYVASHDLQEPLRKIQTFSDRLKNKYSETLGEHGRDYLDRMQNAAARMQTLIQDLLMYSRVATKAQSFSRVNLAEVVQEVLSDLEAALERVGGQVEVGELPTVEADPTQMRQLFQNLIGNALKFHRQEETPRVKIWGRDQAARPERGFEAEVCQLFVEDNGIGFEEKYLARLFQMFQRLHGRSEYEGTGIGLATCRRIVERHGGSITAHSILDGGSTFVVTLPFRQFNGVNKL